jgi:probable phosphoglycerate mutase
VRLLMLGFVIEADGGSRGNPGVAAYGVVIRNDLAEVVFSDAQVIGHATNNVAEYRGLIAGFEWLAQHAGAGAGVRVRLDSKLVIEQMAGRWKIKDSKLVALAKRAQQLASGFAVEYEWVPREQNVDADALLNAALDFAG